MLPDGSSFWYPRLNLPVMLAQPVALCFIIDALPTLTKEGGSNGLGTLRFAQAEPMWSGRGGWGGWDAMSVGSVPAFVDIDDVQSVYRLVSDLREKRGLPKPVSERGVGTLRPNATPHPRGNTPAGKAR
jgi:hypothetical protein